MQPAKKGGDIDMGVYSMPKKDGTVSWWIQYFVNGKRKREVAPVRTRKQAELFLAKRKIEILEGRWINKKELKRIRFNEYAREYLELKRLEGLKDMRRVELSVRHLTGFFGKYYLDAITVKDIHRYVSKRKLATLDRRPQKPIAPATINRELSCLRNMLREALKIGIIDKNPMFGFKMQKEDNIRTRCLTDDEYERLLKFTPRHVYGVIVCAYETGMRRGEILGLTWDQVDLRKGFIFLKGSDTKTGYSRKIPISPTLHECLADLPRAIKSNHVFVYKGKPMGDFVSSWQTLMRKTKIEDFRFHDLRHTFVTRMRRAGIHDHVIMSITGHKTREMFKRYDTVDDNDLHKAIRAYGGSQAGQEAEKELLEGTQTGAIKSAIRQIPVERPRVST